jgi:hypothetical protein
MNNYFLISCNILLLRFHVTTKWTIIYTIMYTNLTIHNLILLYIKYHKHINTYLYNNILYMHVCLGFTSRLVIWDFPVLLVEEDLRCPSMHYFRHKQALEYMHVKHLYHIFLRIWDRSHLSQTPYILACEM